ncbi:hypothetical protein QQ020_35840 [Fulvivirgaceae bacterium BMA12]|uniref:Uncharacterized protein n=1 Tax=Agaribacillus aureus TaxID=3051825 RepID=A0ABT8LI74_9BACT|nr:hypothetical protein [Fulvivirgaceae bacterium BMA12]
MIQQLEDGDKLILKLLGEKVHMLEWVITHLVVEYKIKKGNNWAYDFVYALLFVLERERGI